MYTGSSGCVACPPAPGSVPFWAAAEGVPSSAGAALPTGPYAAAIYSEAIKRTSFYISDILYPSVIPLPGTLPTHLGGLALPVMRAPLTFPGLDSAPDSPPVRSKDLKFGIDRILDEKEELPTPQSPKDKAATPVTSSSPLSPTSPTCSSRSSPPSPPCTHPLCPCSNTVIHTPSQCGTFSYPRLPYGATPSGHHQQYTGHHPGPGQHQGQHPRLSHPLGHHYAMHRPSEFPGPYAILTDHSSQPHHPPSSHTSSHHSQQAQSQQQSQPKRKRSWSRAVFSHLQRKGLEKRFEVQKYVTKPDRKQLAAMLGLTDAQVKVWFQNRRMKWRHAEEAKRKKEDEEKNKPDGAENSDGVSHAEGIDSDEEELEIGEPELEIGEPELEIDDQECDIDPGESEDECEHVDFSLPIRNAQHELIQEPHDLSLTVS